MIVAIDADGTIIDHRYPDMGADVPGAVSWIKEWVANGAQIIIWTMRSGRELEDIVNWYKKHDIPIYGINENPTQKEWTSSNKAYAHLYVDDASFNCPLRENPRYGGRDFVDWDIVGPGVLEKIKEYFKK